MRPGAGSFGTLVPCRFRLGRERLRFKYRNGSMRAPAKAADARGREAASQ
jgi:hypothetical protein